MANRDHDVLLVGVSPRSKVTVIKVDHDGTKLLEYAVTASWITEKTRYFIYLKKYIFLCFAIFKNFHCSSHKFMIKKTKMRGK